MSPRSPSRSPARRLEDTDETQLERLYKPVFVLKPTSFKCSEGQTARFDLKVVGRPMPETFWFHNGKNCTFSYRCMQEIWGISVINGICSDPGHQIVNDYTHKIVVKEDGIQSLIIVPALPADSGEWTVVAQNRAGKTSISMTLSVEGNKNFIILFNEKKSHMDFRPPFGVRNVYCLFQQTDAD